MLKAENQAFKQHCEHLRKERNQLRGEVESLKKELFLSLRDADSSAENKAVTRALATAVNRQTLEIEVLKARSQTPPEAPQQAATNKQISDLTKAV